MTEKKETQNSEIIFSQAADQWFADLAPRVKESTVVKYYNLLYRYIIPGLGDVPLSELNADFIQDFCLRLLRTGGVSKKGLSEKTVSDILSVIRRILSYAQKRQGNQIPDLTSVHIRQAHRKTRVFSVREQTRLTSYLCHNRNLKNLAILISLYTGLRIGEVCALRWEDISFQEHTLSVCRTMQRIQVLDASETDRKTKILISAPKSFSSIREIPIPEALFLLICSYYNGESGYLLTGSDSHFVEPRSLENYFKQILLVTSIPTANYHTLRHSFATRCVEQGFDVKSLSEILGHSTVSITMNRYVHPSMEAKRENMKKMTELFYAKSPARFS